MARTRARRSSQDHVHRVLLVTQYFPPERGAAQVRLEALVAQLARRGYEVEVLTSLPNYPTGQIDGAYRGRPYRVTTEPAATVHRVWVYASIGGGVRRMMNYLSFAATAAVALMFVRRPSLVLIESPPPFPSIPAMVAARVWRAPVVLIVADLWADALRDLDLLPSPIAKTLVSLERFIMRRADAVTAVTEGCRKAILEKRVSTRAVVWMPNGADTDLFHPCDGTGDGRDATVPLAIYAGTMGYVHGLDVLLDAADQLRTHPVRFLLVGGGSERGRLVAEASRRNLTNVEFREPVSPADVAILLRSASVGLATVRPGDSYRVIRSAKVLPMMASGLPVVYSGDDEGAKIIEDTQAGIATPAGDASALAGAIRTLLADGEKAHQMGRRGREWAVANASWTRIVQAWLTELTALGLVR